MAITNSVGDAMHEWVQVYHYNNERKTTHQMMCNNIYFDVLQ